MACRHCDRRRGRATAASDPVATLAASAAPAPTHIGVGGGKQRFLLLYGKAQIAIDLRSAHRLGDLL